MTKRQLLWLFIWIFIFFLIFCLWNKLRQEHTSPKEALTQTTSVTAPPILKEMHFKAHKEEERVLLSGRVKNAEIKTALVDAFGKSFQNVDADDLRIDEKVQENNISDFFINIADDFSHFHSGYLSYHDKHLEIEGVAEDEITKLTLQEQLKPLKAFKITDNLIIKPNALGENNDSQQSLPILNEEEENTTAPLTFDEANSTLPIEEENSSEDIQKSLDAILKNRQVQFLFGTTILTKRSKIIVDDIISWMQKNPHTRIEIAGHTDSYGKRKDNLFLSQERSQSIKEYMMAKGIKEMQLKATGYGESMPLYKNNSRKNRRKNRRVEFKVIGE